MSLNNDFQRTFLIFENEDRGFEAGQRPSGFVRIETRGGKGKLQALARNLKGGIGNPSYKLQLINTGGKVAMPVSAGTFKAEKGRLELEWKFDPLDVAMTGINIDQFDVIAVMADYSGNSSNISGYIDGNVAKLACPLAAYTGEKKDWRRKLGKILHPEFLSAEQYLSTKAVEHIEEAEQSEQMERIEPEDMAMDSDIPVRTEREPIAESHIFAQPEMRMTNDGVAAERQEGVAGYGDLPDPEQESELELESESNGQSEPAPEIEAEKKSDEETKRNEEQVRKDVISACLYADSETCRAYLNNNGINPCEICHFNSMSNLSASNQSVNGEPSRYDSPSTVIPGDITKLKAELCNSFETSDPFKIKRSDYKWWKITDPVSLNNIMFLCNIRTALLFNPAVMMAHVRYRHLITGIYSDREKRKEYLVLGIPGMHQIDRKPFGDMSRWVQADGYRQRQGSFGYWLVYIEPETGKLMKLK